MRSTLLIIVSVLVCAWTGAAADCLDYAAQPELVPLGGLALPGHARDVAVDGDHVFVAAYDAGLVAVDVADPSQPALAGVADTPGAAYRVAVLGDLAAVADRQGGVQFVDISDPAAPAVVGAYPLDDCYDVFATYAYGQPVVFAADYDAGLVVLSVDDPTAPEPITSVAVPGHAVGLSGLVSATTVGGIPEVIGCWLLVACQERGVQQYYYDFYDQTLSHWHNVPLPGYARAVAPIGSVDNGYQTEPAWALTAAMQAGLLVVEPGAGEPVAGSLALDHEAVDLDVWEQDWALVTDGSLHLVNVAAPGAPVLMTRIDTPGTCYGVTTGSQHVYAADGHGGLRIYGISHAGRTGLLYTDADHLASAGPYVCAAGEWGISTTFSVVDVGDPAAPVALGHVFDIFTQDLVATDDHAYAAGNYDYNQSGDGLVVVDLTTPAAPVVTATLDVPGEARGVALAGDHVLIADGFGLRVFDLADPAQPAPVGDYESPGTAWDVVAHGDFAYLADGTTLQVIDISDPSAPSAVGSLAGGYFRRVALAGDLLLSAAGRTLTCIDVSTPASPQALGAIELLGVVEGLSADGLHAYAAAGWSGTHVVDLSDPAAPALVGTLPGPADAALLHGDVLIAGGYRFVTAHSQCGPPSPLTDADSPVPVAAPRLSAGPNPFNPRTTLRYYVPAGARRCELTIHDPRGRRVRRLAVDAAVEGWREVVWSGDDDAGLGVASGVYFVRLSVDERVTVRKVTVAK